VPQLKAELTTRSISIRKDTKTLSSRASRSSNSIWHEGYTRRCENALGLGRSFSDLAQIDCGRRMAEAHRDILALVAVRWSLRAS